MKSPIVLIVLLSLAGPAHALELFSGPDLKGDAELKVMAGLRHGEDINYGLGALRGFGTLQSTGEKSRNDVEFALKPRVTLSYRLENGTVYGGGAGVISKTTADGELSGQFARAGDDSQGIDSAYVGWRNTWLDISYGAREFTVGDGFIIGDGTFNQGHDNGDYWIGAYTAWRNTALVQINTHPVRADIFWLRADSDLGDSRLAGLSIENSDIERWGQIGFLHFQVFDDNHRSGFAGTSVSGIRGTGLHLPSLPALTFYGELVQQRGTLRRTGVKIDALAWYGEVNYQFEHLRWRPRLYYRYARFSGDRPGTPASEEYKGMFFTIFRRDWDTWYQGEITGEAHLFNENQRTHMAKLKVFPTEKVALGCWYYHHALDTPQYFGLPLHHTDWADEINVSFEYMPSDRLYWFVGAAWSSPNAAAREVFGKADMSVVETFISWTFR